jgi:hypothetical protein
MQDRASLIEVLVAQNDATMALQAAIIWKNWDEKWNG